jgi:hypothetical protein
MNTVSSDAYSRLKTAMGDADDICSRNDPLPMRCEAFDGVEGRGFAATKLSLSELSMCRRAT